MVLILQDFATFAILMVKVVVVAQLSSWHHFQR
jgi:hypothetical protein